MAQQTTPAPVASLPPPPPIPESRVLTTDQIQKYLDENKQLILAILDNQNLGKLSESAQYQAQLQRNLLFLAALADEQPQTKAIRAQMMPQGVVPQAQGATTTVVQVQAIPQQVQQDPQSQPLQNPATTDQSTAPIAADTPAVVTSAEAEAGPSPAPESQTKEQSATGGENKEASSDVGKSKEQ